MIEITAHGHAAGMRRRATGSKEADHPFTDLNGLAAERELVTPEIFPPNDFYGHASILKSYAGIEDGKSLKCSIEHALFFADFAWEAELGCSLPAMLVTSPLRFEALRKRTGKALFAIGPMICYAPHELSLEDLERERRRLGRSLLVMPSHSTHHITAEYDAVGYCRYLEQVGSEFDSIRVCLYWKDILLGRAEPYCAAGFECVTAGHMFDPLFLPRLKSLIATSSVVTSNVCGSHVGMCVALGRPHVIAYQQSKSVSAESPEIVRRDFDASEYHDPRFLEVERAFAQWTDAPTPRQQDLVTRYWGLEAHRSREELRRIFSIAEDMSHASSSCGDPMDCVMQRQIERERAAGHLHLVSYLQDHLDRYSRPME